MSKRIHFIIRIFISLIVTVVLLHLFGENVENKFRHFYRDKICNCDTLRFRKFNDSLGVPYINYYSITGNHIGIQRNPTAISFATDKYFNDIVADNNKEYFLNCVNWFLENSTKKDSCLYFEYNFPWVYNTQSPWCSAMAQGLAIKTFTQAYQIFNDSMYLNKIDSIANSFFVEFDNGGVTYKETENNWWYEEYASKKSTKPHVLNGMMYALHGLYYNYQHTKNEHSLLFFTKGINSLKANLSKYDNDKERSFYDLKNKVADEYYHQIHINFLKEFYSITNDDTFLLYYNKWSAIQPEYYLIKSILKPNKAFLFIAIGLFFVIFLLFRNFKVPIKP